MQNGLPYTLLKRNEVGVLYGIGGTKSCDRGRRKC
jgi:hypothetical protein